MALNITVGTSLLINDHTGVTFWFTHESHKNIKDKEIAKEEEIQFYTSAIQQMRMDIYIYIST